jgi:SAM-dependent methyltransferase
LPEAEKDRLKVTFDEDAELYNRVRPGYPEQLFNDLFALGGLRPDSAVAEIGCGTGQATLPLAQRGCRLVCIEVGDNLARVARRRLAEFPGVEVITSAFETWEPGGKTTFDMVLAATSWHWLDPATCYPKARRLLRPGGALAIVSCNHVFPEDCDPFFSEIQECYRASGDEFRTLVPRRPEEAPDESANIEDSGLFEDISVNRYVWSTEYTADEYIDLLNTYSTHRTMEPSRRDILYAEIRLRINTRPERRIRKHYLNILNVARRR